MGFSSRWGNLNGIVSSNIYRAHDAPRFVTGHGVILGYLAVFLFGGSLITTIFLRLENGARLKGERNNVIEGLTDAEIENLGDKK